MSVICLCEAGTVEAGITAAVAERLRQLTDLEVRQIGPLPLPRDAWDPGRKQHGAIPILLALARHAPPDALRVLALTECDLFIPVLSFVFGQAQLNGKLALVSLARLRQEFYGLPPQAHTLITRAGTEAAHELGHTFGLVHCTDPLCAMSLSLEVRQVDRKRELCAGCQALLREGVRGAVAESELKREAR